MAEIRISQLTAKSSNLASTDEFAIAESDGAGGFVSKGGAGQVTVAPTSGVTVNSSGGKTKLAAQYAQATILKVATDTWYLFGDITT